MVLITQLGIVNNLSMKENDRMRGLVDMLIKKKSKFTIETTSNFFNLKYEEKNFKIFAKKMLDFRVFNVSKKIKKDIDNSGVFIDESNLSEFFSVNTEVSSSIMSEKIYGIDIRQAYLTCLKNKKLVSHDTFELASNLKKDERLATVGMLARKKHTFNYEDGKLISCEVDSTPYEKYFYYCVEKTYLTMSSISKKIGNDYLFFWVDCIFFTGEKNIKIVQDCLKSNGFQSSLDRVILKGFHESKDFTNFDFFNLKKQKIKQYKVPKDKKEVLLNKARYSLANLDTKNFSYYYNEYLKFNK